MNKDPLHTLFFYFLLSLIPMGDPTDPPYRYRGLCSLGVSRNAPTTGYDISWLLIHRRDISRRYIGRTHGSAPTIRLYKSRLNSLRFTLFSPPSSIHPQLSTLYA